MRAPYLSLTIPFFVTVATASSDLPPLGCANGNITEYCQEPLGAVTTVVPASFYVAKLPCLDCAIEDRTTSEGYREEDNDLVCIIFLSSLVMGEK